MSDEAFVRCSCGCNTILVFEKVRIPMIRGVVMVDLEQKVFCPNE